MFTVGLRVYTLSSAQPHYNFNIVPLSFSPLVNCACNTAPAQKWKGSTITAPKSGNFTKYHQKRGRKKKLKSRNPDNELERRASRPKGRAPSANIHTTGNQKERKKNSKLCKHCALSRKTGQHRAAGFLKGGKKRVKGHTARAYNWPLNRG